MQSGGVNMILPQKLKCKNHVSFYETSRTGQAQKISSRTFSLCDNHKYNSTRAHNVVELFSKVLIDLLLD